MQAISRFPGLAILIPDDTRLFTRTYASCIIVQCKVVLTQLEEQTDRLINSWSRWGEQLVGVIITSYQSSDWSLSPGHFTLLQILPPRSLSLIPSVMDIGSWTRCCVYYCPGSVTSTLFVSTLTVTGGCYVGKGIGRKPNNPLVSVYCTVHLYCILSHQVGLTSARRRGRGPLDTDWEREQQRRELCVLTK